MVATRRQRVNANKDATGDPPPAANMLKAPAKRGHKKLPAPIEEPQPEPAPKAKGTAAMPAAVKKTAPKVATAKATAAKATATKATTAKTTTAKAANTKATTTNEDSPKTLAGRKRGAPVEPEPAPVVAGPKATQAPTARAKRAAAGTKNAATKKAAKAKIEEEEIVRSEDDDDGEEKPEPEQRPTKRRATATAKTAAVKSKEEGSKSAPTKRATRGRAAKEVDLDSMDIDEDVEPLPEPSKTTTSRGRGAARATQSKATIVAKVEEAEEQTAVPKKAVGRGKGATKATTKSAAKTRTTRQKKQDKAVNIPVLTSGAAAAKRVTRGRAAAKKTAVDAIPSKHGNMGTTPDSNLGVTEPMEQDEPATTPTTPKFAHSERQPAVEATPMVSKIPVPEPKEQHAQESPKQSLLSVSPRKQPTTSPLKLPPISPAKLCAARSEPSNEPRATVSLLQASACPAPLVSPLKFPPLSPSKSAPVRVESSNEPQYTGSLLQASARKPPMASPFKLAPHTVSTSRVSRPDTQPSFTSSLLGGSARKPPSPLFRGPFLGSTDKTNMPVESASMLSASPRKAQTGTPAKASSNPFSSLLRMANPFASSGIKASPIRPFASVRTAAAATASTAPIIEEPATEGPVNGAPTVEKCALDETVATPQATASVVEGSLLEASPAKEPTIEEPTVVEYVSEIPAIKASATVPALEPLLEAPPAKETAVQQLVAEGPTVEDFSIEAPVVQIPVESPVLTATATAPAVEAPLSEAHPATEPAIDEAAVEVSYSQYEPELMEIDTPQQLRAPLDATSQGISTLVAPVDEMSQFNESDYEVLFESNGPVEALDSVSYERQYPDTPEVIPWAIQQAMGEMTPVTRNFPAKSSLRSPQKVQTVASPKKNVTWNENTPQVKSPGTSSPAPRPLDGLFSYQKTPQAESPNTFAPATGPLPALHWNENVSREGSPDLYAPAVGPLHGVAFYFDVHHEGQDASSAFTPILDQLGAIAVSPWPTNILDVTHVVFLNGSQSTLEKVVAADGAVKCVSVGWIIDCHKNNYWLDESPYLIDLSGVPGSQTNRETSAMSANNTLSASQTPVRNSFQTPAKASVADTPYSAFGLRAFPLTPANHGPFAIDEDEEDADLPNTPVTERHHELGRASFGLVIDGDSDDKENKSPATPNYLHPERLVQHTCPPKQMTRTLFEVPADTPIFKRVQAAKRRSEDAAARAGLSRFGSFDN